MCSCPAIHEFDFGKDIFFERMRQAKFPLYAANILNPDGTLIPGFLERSIIDVDGIRIGLTGATDEDAVILSSPGDLKFRHRLRRSRSRQPPCARKARMSLSQSSIPTAPRTKRCTACRRRTSSSAVTITISGSITTAARRRLNRAYDAHFVTCMDVTFTVRDE